MHNEGYCSRSVCLSVCVSVYDYSRTAGNEAAYERFSVQGLEKQNGDFAETTAFESDKLAWSRTTLRGPTHQ